MNEEKTKLFTETFGLEGIENVNEVTTEFYLWSVALETRFVATVEKVSDLVNLITLKFKAEDAEEAQDYFGSGLNLDLSNPQVDSESWSDVHELWIMFDFVWADDELHFETFLNGLSH